MASSSFEFYRAWKQAEIVAVVAEKRWTATLAEPAATASEKLQRKFEFFNAHDTAKKLFSQIFDAANLGSQLDWQSVSQNEQQYWPERNLPQ